MQFVRYTTGGGPRWGVREGATIHVVSSQAGDPGLEGLTNDSHLAAVERSVRRGAVPTVPAGEVSVLAPVPRPGKIVCVGLNYRDHAEEQGETPPETAMLFAKAPTAVADPGEPVVHPPGENVDYEVELAAVVGREARAVDRADAPEYIAGYTVLNDVSGRVAQADDGQFFRGKSYDSFAPMGPTLVADDGFDPHGVDIECRVNDEPRQSSNTGELVFDVYELLEFVTDGVTLRPGDVISTGTPGGVGVFMNPPNFLEAGDTVACEIEGIGVLENDVVSA